MAFETILIHTPTKHTYFGTFDPWEARDFFYGRSDYDDHEFKCPACKLIYTGAAIRDKGSPYQMPPHFKILPDNDHEDICPMLDKLNTHIRVIKKTLGWKMKDCRHIPEKLVLALPKGPGKIAIPGTGGSGTAGGGTAAPSSGAGGGRGTRAMTTSTIKGIVSVLRKVVAVFKAAGLAQPAINAKLKAIPLELPSGSFSYNDAFKNIAWVQDQERIYVGQKFSIIMRGDIAILTSAATPRLKVDQPTRGGYPAHPWHGFDIELVVDFDAEGKSSGVYNLIKRYAAAGRMVNWWAYGLVEGSVVDRKVTLTINAPALLVVTPV